MAGLGIYQFEKINRENLQTQQVLGNIESNIAKISNEASKNKTNLIELQGKYQSLKLEENWKISEANHLLRLAVVELQVSRDVPTSLRLLEAAETHLSGIQDPQLFPIRDLIAKEKAALQAVKLPDLEKLWLQVGALIDQIPSLPTRGMRNIENQNPNANANANANLKLNATQSSLQIPNLAVKTEVESEKSSENKTAEWKKSLKSSWQEFKTLVKIQRHSAPIEPILKESEQVLAKENLLLIFEQLRWAILHTNNAVYQRSISEAKQWLNQYFEASDSRTQQMQTSLDELAKVDLRPALPDIGQALQALQNKG